MIKLMKSTFYKEEETKKKLCEFIMKAKKLSMGDKCQEFEKKFSEYQGRKYSVFFNTGSSANFALIHSLVNLGRMKTNKNGFSALTWPTNVMPSLQHNLNPIPIDISFDHLNISSEKLIQSLKKSDIDFLFITNLLGFCGDLDKIAEVCEKKGIILIEDNCESLGSELNKIKLGNFGMASTFSFFVGHHLSTIEGGMVCTDDEELYHMLQMVRAHGWDRNLPGEKQSKLRRENNITDFYSGYSFYVSAYNFRPTEIQGFIGVEQLKYIDEMNKIRNKNFIEFNGAAQSNPDFYKLDLRHMSFVSNFTYPLICKDSKLFEKYKNKFQENGIEIRPIVGGSIVEQPFFKSYLKNNSLDFQCPNAKKIHEFGFYFPNNPELTEQEKEIISKLLKR